MTINLYDINRNLNGTFKKGCKSVSYWKGKKIPEETKELWSKQRKGEGNSFYGRHHTNETKEKLRKKFTEKFKNAEYYKRYIDSLKKYYEEHPNSRKGEKNGFYGKHHTEEYKTLLKELNSGENGNNWKGGISKEPYPFDFDEELKLFVRIRDNFTCKECGYTERQLGYTLCVHHIDYDKENIDTNNLIALCQSCHGKTNFDREDWTKYFNEK